MSGADLKKVLSYQKQTLNMVADAIEKPINDPMFCRSCNAGLGDGHDCDNCAFCGSDH